jgi:hypothetical protein
MHNSYAIAAFDFPTAARQTQRHRMGLGDIGGGGWPFGIVVPLPGEIRSKPTGVHFTGSSDELVNGKRLHRTSIQR